jgi:uncharacterized damage-inducible protein DinB
MTLGDFIALFKREHAVTRNVLHGFPADKADFKPHERSSTAHQLAWTFVLEEMMMLMALENRFALGGGVPKPPATWAEVLAAFDDSGAKVLAAAEAASEPLLKPVTFFVGPKQTGDYPPVTFIWFMLSDQIHHRGQMSVYSRMAGGKVPSIYGPSADEPWT